MKDNPHAVPTSNDIIRMRNEAEDKDKYRQRIGLSQDEKNAILTEIYNDMKITDEQIAERLEILNNRLHEEKK